MAWATHTYNSLNGYCGNCSIVLSSKIHVMIENKKVITWSLIVLFLSLSIVYSLTYQKKESLFKSTIKSWNEITNQIWNQEQNPWSATQDSTNLKKSTENVKTTNSVSLWDVKPSWVIASNNQTHTESTTSVNISSSNAKILPGTTEYFGTLDIVSILWEKQRMARSLDCQG